MSEPKIQYRLPGQPSWSRDGVMQEAELPWTFWQRLVIALELVLGFRMVVHTHAWTEHEAGRTEGEMECWTIPPKWWPFQKTQEMEAR